MSNMIRAAGVKSSGLSSGS